LARLDLSSEQDDPYPISAFSAPAANAFDLPIERNVGRVAVLFRNVRRLRRDRRCSRLRGWFRCVTVGTSGDRRRGKRERN
jgi:hypothetical protein